MTTRAYRMPRTDEFARVGQDGVVRVNPAWIRYLRGIEDGTARVADNLPAGSTSDQILTNLKSAGLMKAD